MRLATPQKPVKNSAAVKGGHGVLDIIGKEFYPLLMKSVISSKGQVTVPVVIREKLGLLPGTVVNFQIADGGALLRKGAPGAHPVDLVYGKLRLSKAVDDLIDEMRGPRPRKS